jgi:anti-sigma factor RsiW
MTEIHEEKAIRSYLLGELSPEERAEIEARLLADDAYFQQLLLVEEDLFDNYLDGELTPQEQAHFDSHFLNAPERRRDLRLATAFKKYVASSAVKDSPGVVDSSPSWFSSLFLSLRPAKPGLVLTLATALALLIGGFWLIRRWSQSAPVITRSEPAATPTPFQQSPPTTSPNKDEVATQTTPVPANVNGKEGQNPPSIPKEERPKPAVLTIALASGLVRGGGEMKRVKVPPETTSVRLQLELPSDSTDYQSYRAVLQNGSGQEVSSKGGLRARATAQGKTIILDVPAKLIKRDDYYLRLSGQTSGGAFESAGSYTFRVIE